MINRRTFLALPLLHHPVDYQKSIPVHGGMDNRPQKATSCKKISPCPPRIVHSVLWTIRWPSPAPPVNWQSWQDLPACGKRSGSH